MAMSDSAQLQPEQSPSDVYDQILEATEQGDETELRIRLEQWRRFGLEQNIIDTSLGRAIEANQAGSVQLLMEYGARTDSDTVTTAVENAVSTEVWQALLDGGWDPNSEDVSGDPVIL